jgi:hypothetical protein
LESVRVDRAVAGPGIGTGTGVPGRRTVTITGRGVEPRSAPNRHGRHDQRRPYVPRHERNGFRPDRTAGLAVALALLLILVAAASAHAVVLNRYRSTVSTAVVRTVESTRLHRLR